MIGDSGDMLARLRAVLPDRWFPDVAPVLDGLLSGLADTASALYRLVQYARGQARIATASGAWLDMIAKDYFGSRVRRRNGEPDAALRSRVLRELLRPRNTRSALTAQLLDLTGTSPWVFEPSRPLDTGTWGGRAGYNVAGGWGSLSLPFQCLVSVRRPPGTGIPKVPGYGTGAGYGVVGSYGNPAMMAGITDADIMSTIAAVLPVACTAWTRITS